jgi:type I pantothenate kinase
VYLPLSRLLNLYVAAVQGLYRATSTFLGHGEDKVPFLIGLAGSVAVGKSTAARALRELLSRWPHHPRVDVVTTDGFLHPTAVLAERDLLRRKGFPESYDVRALLAFVRELKAGRDRVTSPVYSHLVYDIVPGETKTVVRPDIVIVEGLNVLQTGVAVEGQPRVFVSDFFDFTIYVDAEVAHIRAWYVERFLALRNTAFRDPSSYFHRYASLTDAEAVETAGQIWAEINEPNLRTNILPTRDRADLVLKKGAHHAVEEVRLRKL